MDVNLWAVLACAVVSMVIGSVWYGPIFGKKWLEVIGANELDLERRKQMQKESMPLYGVQFVLTLFQVYVFSTVMDFMYLVDPTRALDFGYVFVALFLCAGLVIPTVAGSSMWTADTSKVKWARFLIQSGYQVVLFVAFGLILGYWK